MRLKKGVFITFEGPESCGKSTQARLLGAYLVRKGRRVVFLREPGGTPVSEKIRRILLDKKNGSISSMTEMLLYMASRRQTVERVIAPALAKGDIVICDRFLDSTIVYQGYGLGLDMKLIRLLGTVATMGISPDLTILLETPLKEALDSIGSRKDRIESRAFAYHRRVKAGYGKLAAQEPGRITTVRLMASRLATQAKIRGIVDALIRKKI